MLGKLFKYDFKWMSKVTYVYVLILIVISIALKIVESVDQTFLLVILDKILVSMFISCIVSILLTSSIRIWVRFINNFYKDESYLTHTLPVTKNELFNSKVLAGICSLLLSALVIVACLALVFINKESLESLKMMWDSLVAVYNSVFAVFFGIYKDHRYRMLDATVSPYYLEYDMSDISRGDIDSVTTAHLFGLFTQIQENRSVSDVIKELEPIYNSLDADFTYNAFANDIAWNLALAYVKDDQIDKAITILQKLKDDNPETPIYNKADELIKKLQDLYS